MGLLLMLLVSPFTTVDVLDEIEFIEGDGSWPVEDERLPPAADLLRTVWVLLPAFARVSVILLWYEIEFAELEDTFVV